VLVKVDDILSFLEIAAREESGLFQQIVLPARAPGENGSRFFLNRLDGPRNYFLDGFRAVDPLKIVFYQAREQVYPVAAKPVQRLIAGVKACDLKALKILDRALINEDFVDPAYQIWRESITILSADCTEAGPACHCTLAGGKPFSEEGFDLNLSRTGDSYSLTVGSDKGHELLEIIRCTVPVKDGDDQAQASVAERRAILTDLVNAQNSSFQRSQDYSRLRESQALPWIEESRGCVGCGACTNVCPTCYCLMLNEEGGTEQFIKVRSYDSCQWHGYARVAGGATPRPRMHQRFRNRYLCKFLYMPSNFQMLGCTGCGRCTEACPGQIDFRSVVYNVMEKELPDVEKVPDPAGKGQGEV
jgi:ferredoxin